MNYEKYEIRHIDQLTFTFISIGKRGAVEKVIKYIRASKRIFNLGFGDRIEGTLDYDDEKNTNNGDITKVIATVISTFPMFSAAFPNHAVLFNGSDTRRDRLYHYVIKNHIEEFSKLYDIYGIRNGVAEVFNPEQKYDAYAVKQKDSNDKI